MYTRAGGRGCITRHFYGNNRGMHPKDNPTCPFHVLYYISSPSRCIPSPFLFLVHFPRGRNGWIPSSTPGIPPDFTHWVPSGVDDDSGAPIEKVDVTKMVGFLSTRFLWDRDLFFFFFFYRRDFSLAVKFWKWYNII